MARRAVGGMLRLGVHLLSCALLRPLPRPRSLAERLAMLPTKGLPLRKRVVVRWNEHQVPFIEAENDDDLAVALGLVHAHLRLAQMELLRRISRGRTAELLGAVAIDFDHALRILDLGRAMPAMESALPDDTRAWL